MSDPELDIRRNKLRFRAWRRGFREADLILGAFADAQLAAMREEQLDAFEILIDQPDHDLYGWIIGRDEAPEAFRGDMLDRIRAFHLDLPAARGDATGA
jgi:antitoxin CptB